MPSDIEAEARNVCHGNHLGRHDGSHEGCQCKAIAAGMRCVAARELRSLFSDNYTCTCNEAQTECGGCRASDRADALEKGDVDA